MTWESSELITSDWQTALCVCGFTGMYGGELPAGSPDEYRFIFTVSLPSLISTSSGQAYGFSLPSLSLIFSSLAAKNGVSSLSRLIHGPEGPPPTVAYHLIFGFCCSAIRSLSIWLPRKRCSDSF